MTKAQAERFVAEWQSLLAPEWEIKCKEGPAPEVAACEHSAAVGRAAGGEYLRATIYLHETVGGDMDDSEARHDLLHELLHLTLTDLEHAAKEPTNALSLEAAEVARGHINRHTERTVDRLASAFESVSD